MRIGNLNLLNNPESLYERVNWLIGELATLNFDILMLQEVNTLVDFDVVELIRSQTDLKYVAVGNSVVNKDDKTNNGNVTLSRHPILEAQRIMLPGADDRQCADAVAIKIMFEDKEVHAINVHLMWGGDKENVRLAQIVSTLNYVNKTMQHNSEAIIVLGGDFNAGEESAGIRLLKGLQPHHDVNTFWVDAWQACGSDKATWTTSDPTRTWGLKTAISAGIRKPELIPMRRIDYIFVHGFAYGRPGCPTYFSRFADTHLNGLEISDHYGIYTDLDI